MKAISLWQPWASALFTGLKPDETRSWSLPDCAVGVPVAIHAAKRDTKAEREFFEDTVSNTSDAGPFRDIGIGWYHDLPRGAVIGTVVFASPVRMEIQRHVRSLAQQDWGDYSEGRYAWPLVSYDLFAKPIPCIGRQGFFDWEPTPPAVSGECLPVAKG